MSTSRPASRNRGEIDAVAHRNSNRRSSSLPAKELLFAFAVGLLVLSVTVGTATAISSRALFTEAGAAGDQLGFAVASAGDVNGDGYIDVIVGAPTNGAGGGNAGAAYIYFGGPAADNVPDVTIASPAAGAFWGYSVASAGDVNGDGFADVIVGGWNAGGGNGGADVYYGGSPMNAGPDLVLTGQAAGDQFGLSVSSAGDVNGDRFSDVIVGANDNDAGGGNAGRAYVFFGGPGADNIADLTLTGAGAGDSFGGAVSSAGDVNGDGFGDVIVGAIANGGGAGRAYVFYGGPSSDAVADLTVTGFGSENLGNSVSSAGDVNGDGFGDVIVGANRNGANIGRAYVYYGGPVADATPDLTLVGVGTNDFFGTSVSSVGDVNGDGYADLIVGADGFPSGLNTGRVYVYYGGLAPDAVADLILTGESAGNRFGHSVASAGDMDGDGYGDVIVGAYSNSTGGANAGRAYVTAIYPYQVLSPNGGETWVAGQNATVRWRGHDVADVALSLDGGLTWSTVASGVGSEEINQVQVVSPGPTILARVRVSYSGQPATHATSDVSDGSFHIVTPVTPPAAASRLQLTPTGAAALDFLGGSVSAAGDFNGDGYSDVIVGASGNDVAGSNAGRAYIYYGGPGTDAIADLTLTGEAANNAFGTSVSTAGDVNGDGYTDVIVGASGSPGRAYVYYGGPSADVVADLTFTGEAGSDFFGSSVSSAGDVNGDGYADVIVGAYLYNNVGRAYVYYGGPGADAIPDLTLTGEALGDNFGYSVSGAGDVNGDGFADVIVGAWQSDAGGSNIGRAYIYFGGPTADTIADVTLTGAAVGDYFGISVSAAGDVNGDGLADVIVGAYANDAGGTDAGRAYVFYGGPAPDAIPDLTLTGAAANDEFGGSVSSAGDVNGDGYSDVIVAAYYYDPSALKPGRAYVFYGGPGADEIPDFVFTGAAPADKFGSSVSTAGDVNGDGYDDVIVGALGNDTGGSNAGRAYVYDMNRYHLLSPNGGETWPVGALKMVSWLGAEPADISLSVDGGRTYDRLLSHVGGAQTNTVSLRVPHAPTKFARLRLTPFDALVSGSDQSDSTYTIQTSVALLALLAAPAPQGASGAVVSWSTDPGPEDLSGYRLEKATGGDWRALVTLTRETTYTDLGAGPAARYRLFAVNGFGEELLLGETSFRPYAALTAWPLPYRGGNLSIAFATRGGLGGGVDHAEVKLYNASGRLIRTIAQGEYTVGYQSAVWDGRDANGRRVAAGIYFLRSGAPDQERAIKLVVLR